MSDGGAQPKEGRSVSTCSCSRQIRRGLSFQLVFSCLYLSAGSKQYSASIAFTLALFSHLVNHVNIRLQAELEDVESQVPPLPTDTAGEIFLTS